MNIFRKRIFKSSILIFILATLFLTSVSCSGNSDSVNQETNAGVISLLDSLGVGDVPKFPGSDLEVDIYRNLEQVMKELPEFPGMFKNSIFFSYITRKTPEDVGLFYKDKMKELEWEFLEEYDYGDRGNFYTWQKMANTGVYITYGVYAGNYNYNNRTSTLILSGFIIPEDKSAGDESDADLENKNIVSEGTVYLENPLPPSGQGLIPVKSISMGIDQWELWLQEGSKTKGSNEVSLAEDPVFLKSVMFKRSSEPDDGGAAGIYYKTNIDVRSFDSLLLWLVGKIEGENGGNIANTNPQWFPEGALQVKIKYADEEGKEFEWYHGFYYSGVSSPDVAHFSRVSKGSYFWYIGPDMTEFENKPAAIKEIWVYGFGWDFTSFLAEIDIIGNV